MKKGLKFLVFIVLLLDYRSNIIEARQASCTRTIAANLTAIDQAIYGDQMGGPNENHNGDVLCIAANGATPIDITSLVFRGEHNIELRGAGTMPLMGSAGGTIFHATDPVNAMMEVREATSGNITLSNIRWVFDSMSPEPVNAETLLELKETSSGKPIIVHHNDFLVSSVSCNYPKIITTVTQRGVVYRNKFINTPLMSCGYSTTNQDAIFAGTNDTTGSSWNSVSTMGSADTVGENNFYVETNFFQGMAVGIDRQSSSRVVMRFNTMDSAATADHGFDSSTLGERHTEYYYNTHICSIIIALSSWHSQRGGTGMIFGNVFPLMTAMGCGYPNTGQPSIKLSQFKAFQCEEINGWPGIYPDTYPIFHQTGWGWKSPNSHTGVGSATAQGQPGGSGGDQSVEPIYIFNNSGTNSANLLDVSAASGYQCRAMAVSTSTKASGNSLTINSSNGPLYSNSGQQLFLASADLMGGSTPTVSDSGCGTLTWVPLSAGTNGSMRLAAWTARLATTCIPSVTLTYSVTAASARAMTLVALRGTTSSPVDKNPSVITDNTADYVGPSSGTLTSPVDSTHAQLVVGYFALNGPSIFSGSGSGAGWHNDNIDGASGYTRAVSYSQSGGDTGINGTSGGADNTNVVVAVTVKPVEVTTAESPVLSNTTASRNGLAGTVTFKINGGTHELDLKVEDVLQANREYYYDNASFSSNCTTGTGTGSRASRPAAGGCSNGVAYWSTDQGGNWDATNGSSNDGCLDLMVSGAWSNCFYTPYIYPHNLANVNGSGASCTPDHLTFTAQPSNALLGVSIGTVSVGIYDNSNTLCSSATNTITFSKHSGTCTGMTLNGTTSGAASSGILTETNLNLTAATGACSLDAAASGLTGTVSNSFNITAPVTGAAPVTSRIRVR